MSLKPFNTLDRFASHPDVSLRVSGGSKVLEAERAGITIRVIVPYDVLEWFVAVLDGAAVIDESWCDYEGYDDTPNEELAQRMASDIGEFVTAILNREIRLAAAKKTFIEVTLSRIMNRDVKLFAEKQNLEWMSGGSWERAFPL